MKTGFFEETPGRSSNMRLNSTLLTCGAVIVAIAGVFTGLVDANLVALTGVLAGSAQAGKVWQKSSEVKREIANTKEL